MTIRPQILADLKNLSPEDFIARHIFDKHPVVFSNRENFVKWKGELAKAIDVDAAAITIVGSSNVCISLNYNKSFRDFHSLSDIDVAVISQHYFQASWRYLRSNGNVRMRLNEKQRAAWDEHVHRLIFWGTIATDKIIGLLPFGGVWLDASKNASKAVDIANREVKFRIYADYESLRAYQLQSVKSSREKALTGGF